MTLQTCALREPAEPTATLVVIAKRPVPGRVKTRLQTRFTPEQAAELAEAALRDTLEALAATPAVRRVVALDVDAEDDTNAEPESDAEPGDHQGPGTRPGAWLPDGFDVVAQGGGGLDERLATAFASVLDPGAPGWVPGPALLVGMDTPQLTPDLLSVDWTGLDAVLGLAPDGGYWAIGFRESLPAALHGVPMSTEHTGAAQLARLRSLGLRVGLLPWLRDVDTPTDAAAAAAMAPASRFARTHERILRELARSGGAPGTTALPPLRLLEAAFAGEAVEAVTADSRLRLSAASWSGDADPVDHGILDRCRGPVLDVGCGPGRMVSALARRGHSALGIDVSRVAVDTTAARGGSVLRRRVQDRLPGEGRWGTVLLADGNIGIGGDPLALLARSVDLLAPGGRVVVEAEPGDDDLDVRDAVVLEGADGRRSHPLAWARLGAGALTVLAGRVGLELVERWDCGGRVVLVLEHTVIEGLDDRTPALDTVADAAGSRTEPDAAAS